MAQSSSDDPGTTRAATGRGKPRATVRNFRIDVVDGPARGRTMTVDIGRCSIGSHEKNDLVIDDPTVSRFHCEVSIREQGIHIRDLGSTNGILIGDTRLVDGYVGDGATLDLGDSSLQLRLAARIDSVPVSESESFGNLIGVSIPMRMAFAALEQAASSAATVLLTGETGTGKEEAAIAIHENSPRASGPFIVVDCGALPSNLLESELFGHEKGSFTGASTARVGAFEDADGGTIFLDEIGELPIEMQPKLLRALERKQIRRLGSNRHQQVDVRVIAATHRDLREQVNKDAFRSDLYYRLAVVCVELPALRDRPEDIPVLARHIAQRLGATKGDFDRIDDPDFYAALASGGWPGNVRELRNYVERCVVLGRTLPVEPSAPPRADDEAVSLDLPYHEAKRRTLERFERSYISGLLERHDQKVMKAAEAAGMGRVALWRLARKHGLGDKDS